MLTAEQLAFFDTEGYLVVEDFASKDEVIALKNRAGELLNNFDEQSVSVFSTTAREKIGDQFILDSADKISFFLEEDAVNKDGKLKYDKTLAINKIAHDPVFRLWSRSQKMCALFKSLQYEQPTPVQSMYICKQPRIGGYVIPHQDGTFLATDPQSTIGVWVALEEATTENGCLFVLPKSHHDGVACRLGRKDGKPFSLLEGEEKQWDLNQFIPKPVKAGTMILLDGATAHYSNHNASEKSRHAYSVHFVEGTNKHTWLKDNWLQRSSALPFEPLYIP